VGTATVADAATRTAWLRVRPASACAGAAGGSSGGRFRCGGFKRGAQAGITDRAGRHARHQEALSSRKADDDPDADGEQTRP